MEIGPTELFIILVIVVMLFGVGRISRVAGELGTAVREFRQGLAGNRQVDTHSTQLEGKEKTP